MLKRTIHFSNPAHLSIAHMQLIVELKGESSERHTVPIEDLGIVVLEHPHISLTTQLLEALLAARVAVVTCGKTYLPNGLLLPLDGNSEQTERMHVQINASVPLKKQLWQQTIKAKIYNQAIVLASLGLDNKRLLNLRNKVVSGDTANCEAQAAAYYWNVLFGNYFVRQRGQSSPNAQLNYGYAILRAIIARGLTASGMLPTLGIHHKNKYNAYCLADDIMEPYRPYVDWIVLNIPDLNDQDEGLTREQKIELLKLPQIDVMISELKRPLFHAVSTTTASLYKCFNGDIRKLAYPEFHVQEPYHGQLPF
jgi:CRISPR-associated protein Cas1